MPAAIAVCVVWLGGVVAIGALAVAVAGESDGSPTRWDPLRQKVGASVDAVSGQFGRLVTGVLVVLAGWSATIIVGWLLGELAHAVEDAVDWPVFRWFRDHQVDGWSDAWQTITGIGSPQLTAQVATVGAVVLGVMWWRRQRPWWMPGLCLALGLVLVRYAQFLLKEVVDRGHPPTTLGTWPSGGCARVIVVYGLIMFFLLRWGRVRGRRPWILWATATAFLASVQGYARTYNLEHWVTDVIGGLVFGTMVIALVIAFSFILERPRPRPGRAPAPELDARVTTPVA